MKIFITLVILVTATNIWAESLSDSLDFPFGEKKEQRLETPKDSNAPQTLLDIDGLNLTGFGGPIMTYGKLNDESMIMAGFRGAFVFSDFLILGISGMGMASPYKREAFTGERYRGDYEYAQFGYGGTLIGVSLFQKSILNMSFTTLVGGGELCYTKNLEDDYEDEENSESRQEFFVAEPMLLIHMNVTKWFRIGGGVSYRYTDGINTGNMTDSDFRDFSAVFVADFGIF